MLGNRQLRPCLSGVEAGSAPRARACNGGRQNPLPGQRGERHFAVMVRPENAAASTSQDESSGITPARMC